MPSRSPSYQASSGFTDDATVYDGSISTGYTVSGGIGATVALSGKLNLGAACTATNSVKYYWKWEDTYTRILESSNDDITYTAAVGIQDTIANGSGGARSSTFRLTSATSFQYWRLSLQNQDTTGFASSVSLMEFEALDASGVHIPENAVGLELMTPAGTVQFTGAGTATVGGLRPYGTVQFVGAATVTIGQPVRGSGTVQFRGKAIANDTYALIPAGTVQFTGACALFDANNLSTINGAGSVVFSGSAIVGGIQPMTPVGSLTFAGVANVGGTIIYAQSGFDYLDWYPGIGDVFGHLDGSYYDNGKYGKPMELRAGKVLRGAAWGLILASTPKAPYPGGVVYVKETLMPFADGGNGQSVSDGRYFTGSPGGRGNLDQTAECRVGDTPYPAIGTTFHARKRNRNSFLIGQPAQYSAIENCSERGWLHVGVLKKVYTFFIGSNELVFKSADLAPDSWVKMSWDARRSTLFLLGKLGSLFKVYSSTDGGQNVAELNSVTGKSGVLQTDSERGMLIWLYQDNSDVISQQSSLDGGVSWGTATACLLDGTAMKGVLLDMTYDRRRAGLFLTMQNTGSNPPIKVVSSTDMGLNWATSIS